MLELSIVILYTDSHIGEFSNNNSIKPQYFFNLCKLLSHDLEQFVRADEKRTLALALEDLRRKN